MLKQWLAMAFEQWQCVATWMKHQEMLVSSRLMKLVNVKLCATVTGWVAISDRGEKAAGCSRVWGH